jgi:hypothetical protein
MANQFKKSLLTVFILILTGLSVNSNAQSPTLQISETTVNIGKEEFKGTDFNFPFSYGNWSPRQTLYNHNGTVITASFKLAGNSTARSEIKNSSLRIMVKYTVEHAGDKREKTTEQIKYLDAERKFKTSESFSLKANKYDVRVVKISFSGMLSQ